MFALPIFTASRPATIVGVHELNFCVRNGNRWTLMTINTNSETEGCPSYIKLTIGISVIRPYQLIYLVTHTGFEPMLTA